MNETSAGRWKDVPKKLGLPRTSWSLEGGGRPNWQKVRGQVYPAGSAELPSAAAYSGGEARVVEVQLLEAPIRLRSFYLRRLIH